MLIASDLHLHSKYSRAVSQMMVLPEMAKWARKKGIDLLSACDFTHPLWFRELSSQLEESGEGIYKIKNQSFERAQEKNLEHEKEIYFLLSTEISSIFTHKGKLRRIHNLVFSPSLEIVEKINSELRKRNCNLNADGRPIIGLSSKQLLELILTIDKRCILIPCHAWTPHFGLYGSASGYDSIEESFEQLSKYIYAIETGISSDPWMNWQMKELENRSIVSFSDAHSAPKMGRELTVFELSEISYGNIGKALAKPDENHRIAYTVEFYPEEGKYHYSGHRNCKVVVTPEDVKKNGNICPVCNKKLTEGVMFRVQQLAQNSEFKAANSKIDEHGVKWTEDPSGQHPGFVKLVPLNEIIAESMDSTVQSEKVKQKFDDLCYHFGSELEILLKTPLEKMQLFAGDKITEGIKKVRAEDISLDPGYDGEYGKVKIWSEENMQTQTSKSILNKKEKEQMGLF